MKKIFISIFLTMIIFGFVCIFIFGFNTKSSKIKENNVTFKEFVERGGNKYYFDHLTQKIAQTINNRSYDYDNNKFNNNSFQVSIEKTKPNYISININNLIEFDSPYNDKGELLHENLEISALRWSPITSELFRSRPSIFIYLSDYGYENWLDFINDIKVVKNKQITISGSESRTPSNYPTSGGEHLSYHEIEGSWILNWKESNTVLHESHTVTKSNLIFSLTKEPLPKDDIFINETREIFYTMEINPKYLPLSSQIVIFSTSSIVINQDSQKNIINEYQEFSYNGPSKWNQE